jgi:2-aminoethylphosphonate dioxygenase
VKKIKHLALLLSVDPSTFDNGCLEVVKGSHKMDVPIADDNCIDRNWVANQDWTPVELEAGQVLVFGSYLAHRSAANHSSVPRKALYATYNRASEGDLHDEYYRQRKIEYPPTHLRKKGENFEFGSLRYGYGSPM